MAYNIADYNSKLWKTNIETHKEIVNDNTSLQTHDEICAATLGKLNHCVLEMPYGHIDMDQYWTSLLLVAWRDQARLEPILTFVNIDLSLVTYCGVHLRAISGEC